MLGLPRRASGRRKQKNGTVLASSPSMASIRASMCAVLCSSQ